jgi:uncharacterized RDD family membrane protein YckC
MLWDVVTQSGPAAGLGDRIVAFAVDGLALAVVQNVVFFGFGLDVWIGVLLSFALWQVYFACFWSSIGNGQTPGNRLFGLRVQNENGVALDVRQALKRSMVLYFGSFLAIAPLSVLLSKDGRGIHDRAAGSRVVRVQPS